MQAIKIGALTIWQSFEPALGDQLERVSERPSYLTHFTCALTATLAGAADIAFETMKW